MPATATAQGTGGLPASPLASPPAAGDYRLGLSLTHPNGVGLKSGLFLDRVFVPRSGFGKPYRRHAAAFAFGAMEVTAEAVREKDGIAPGGIWRGAHALDRFSAIGINAGWAPTENDRFSLGVAANVSKRTAPEILAGRKHIDGDAIIADCTWNYGPHLRMSFAWRVDKSGSTGGINRIVELAQGAALREQGVHLVVSYALLGAGASRGTTLGFTARDARVAAEDLAAIGSANRQDIQTALFVKTAF